MVDKNGTSILIEKIIVTPRSPGALLLVWIYLMRYLTYTILIWFM